MRIASAPAVFASCSDICRDIAGQPAEVLYRTLAKQRLRRKSFLFSENY